MSDENNHERDKNTERETLESPVNKQTKVQDTSEEMNVDIPILSSVDKGKDSIDPILREKIIQDAYNNNATIDASSSQYSLINLESLQDNTAAGNGLVNLGLEASIHNPNM